MGLSQAQIAELLAKKRTKGVYEAKLMELYADSDEAGVDVGEQWPEFAGKAAATLYQGFNNAAKKLSLEDALDIVNRDGHVFILVKTRVALVMATTETDEVEVDADENTELEPEAENVENGSVDVDAAALAELV